MSTSFRSALPFLLMSQLVYSSYAVAAVTHDAGGKIRVRYADLTEDAVSGKSASLLIRGNLKTQWTESFTSFIELDYVEDTFEDEHSNGLDVNGKPLFLDVPGEDLNQLWFKYEGEFAELTFGRQAINLDDQRFVSTVSFWQNEQTFDALRVDKPLFSASNFMYSYVANANRIYGDKADKDRPLNADLENNARPGSLLGDHQHHSHLFHLEVNEWDFTQWVVYAYLIDNQDIPGASNNTLGTRYEFTFQPGAFRYHIEAELARQQRTEFPANPENNYAKIFLSAAYSSVELSARYEYLGSQRHNGRQLGVVAPIGSLNEFQGWADGLNRIHGIRGIEDSSLKLKWRHHPWKFDLRHHWFADSESQLNYGRETDLDISFDLAKHHEIHFRYADFRVDEDAEDVLKSQKFAVISYVFEF